MTNEQKRVTTFHRKYGQPAPTEPTVLTEEQRDFRYALIQEELLELADSWDREDFIDQIDAVVDLLYVVYGTAVAMGVDVEPFFQEAHRCNMLKDQNPDGKPIKGERYEHPDMVRVYEEKYIDQVAPGSKEWGIDDPVYLTLQGENA